MRKEKRKHAEMETHLALTSTETYIYIGIAIFAILLAALITVLVVVSKKTSSKRLAAERRALAAERESEKEVERIISETEGGHCRVLKDYILDVRGGTAEMNFVLITLGGVFVIEVKNWTGTIHTHTDADTEWVQKSNGKRTLHYSPLRQSAKHAEYLRDIVPGVVPITPVLVFTNKNARIKGPAKKYILTPQDLKKRLYDEKKVISPKTMEAVEAILTEYRSKKTPEEHAEFVKSVQKDKKRKGRESTH
ncbi:MAG: NERD domain-containing protein, partial [Clostridia bacterium]|nr:NERD domain-containing protein [Clostridia bacterium]